LGVNKFELKNEIGRFEAKMDAGFKATQTVIVDGAECTMKALKGDTEPMKEFLKKAETYWRCLETPEDCDSAIGSQKKGEK
jgi:hypothetical protein